MKKNIIWSFVFISYSSLLSQAIIENSRGAVYPYILKHFNLTNNTGSLIFVVSTFMGLITSSTSQYWIKRWGVIKSLTLGNLCLFIGSLSYFLIPYHQLPFFVLILFSIILGSGISLIAIPMNILMAKGLPTQLRRQGYSGLHAIYGLGSLASPLFLSFWIRKDFSWFAYFLPLSILPLTPLFYSLKLFKQESIDQKKAKEQTKSKKNQSSPPLSIKILTGLVFGFYVSSEILISSRLVLYLKELKLFSNQEAQYYLSLFFTFLFIGRLLFIFAPKKISSSTVLVISLLLSFIFSLIGIFIHPFFLCLTGLTMSFFFPVSMDWLSSNYGHCLDEMTGNVFTWIGINLVIIHTLFGQVASKYGLDAAFLLIPILLVFSLFVFLLLPKITLRLAKQQESP